MLRFIGNLSRSKIFLIISVSIFTGTLNFESVAQTHSLQSTEADRQRKLNKEAFEKAYEANVLIDENRPAAALKFINGLHNQKIVNHPYLFTSKAMAHIALKNFGEGDKFFNRYVTFLRGAAHKEIATARKFQTLYETNKIKDPAKIKVHLQKANSFYQKVISTNVTRRTAYKKLKVAPIPETVNEYEQIIRAYSNNLVRLSEMVIGQEGGGEQAAILNEAIRIDNKNASAYSKRGYLRLLDKKSEDAISDFSKVIALSPNEHLYRAYILRAGQYDQNGRIDLAISDLTEALKLKPASKMVLYRRASIRAKHQLTEDAIEDYSRIIKLYPKESLAYEERGKALSHSLAKHKLAISDFSRAIEFYANRPGKFGRNKHLANLYYERGFAKRLLTNFRGALGDFSKAIELNKTNDDYFAERGVSFSELGLHDKAISDFTAAIELNPRDENHFILRASERIETKEYKLAIADATKAIEIHPNQNSAYYFRGVANYRLKKFSEALSDFNDSLNRPLLTIVRSYLFRSKIYCSQGKRTLARADEKRYLQQGGAKIIHPCK